MADSSAQRALQSMSTRLTVKTRYDWASSTYKVTYCQAALYVSFVAVYVYARFARMSHCLDAVALGDDDAGCYGDD